MLGRYRPQALLLETATVQCFDAVHRNGVRVWLKRARSREHGAGLLREAALAHRVGATLRVIDDGQCEGLQVLVLDPAEGASRLDALATCVTFDHAVRIGDRLLALFASLHASGHAVGGASAAEVLVTASFDVAFLGLDRAVPATTVLVQQDLAWLAGALTRLLDGAQGTDLAARADIVRAKSLLEAGKSGDTLSPVRELHIDWRMLLPGSLPPPRGLTPSLAFAVPAAVSHAARSPGTAALPGSPDAAPPVSQHVARLAVDPLGVVHELPGLVRAVSVGRAPRPRARRLWLPMAACALALAGLAVCAWTLAAPDRPQAVTR